MSLNKVMLIGNLGQDPVLRKTHSGTSVTNFALATNERWTAKNGERQERTTWHKIVIYGKQAEICAEHLNKGSKVYVEGRINMRDWVDDDGNQRTAFEINASNVLFLDAAGTDDTQDAPEDSIFDGF